MEAVAAAVPLHPQPALSVEGKRIIWIHNQDSGSRWSLEGLPDGLLSKKKRDKMKDNLEVQHSLWTLRSFFKGLTDVGLSLPPLAWH